METKVCSKCKVEKALCKENFYWQPKVKKFMAMCFVCYKETRTQYRKNNKEKIKNSNKLNYYHNKEKRSKYRRQQYIKNKEVLNLQSKKYYQNNKEKFKEYAKKYYQNNKEILKEKAKQYHHKNKEYRNKKRSELQKKNRNKINTKFREKMLNDIQFAIYERFRSLVKAHLKKYNISKKSKSIKNIMPYTIHKLREHLESQFEPWMNWDNWGKYNSENWNDNDASTWTWQIDHIVPASTFKYTSMEDEEFKKCWSLENLRPLSAKQNIIDGASKIRHKEKEVDFGTV